MKMLKLWAVFKAIKRAQETKIRKLLVKMYSTLRSNKRQNQCKRVLMFASRLNTLYYINRWVGTMSAGLTSTIQLKSWDLAEEKGHYYAFSTCVVTLPNIMCYTASYYYHIPYNFEYHVLYYVDYQVQSQFFKLPLKIAAHFTFSVQY